MQQQEHVGIFVTEVVGQVLPRCTHAAVSVISLTSWWLRKAQSLEVAY